jgi:hypothetical protein
MLTSPKPKPPINEEILDMIEEGDRVAVRSQLTGTYDDGKPMNDRSWQSIDLRTNVWLEDWDISIPALSP